MATVQTVWGVLLGALGALFAVGAIVGGLVIWRLEARGRKARTEHVAELRALADQYSTQLQDLANGYAAQITAARTGVDELKMKIAAASERAPDGAANPDIARLQADVQAMTRQIAALTLPKRVPSGRLYDALLAAQTRSRTASDRPDHPFGGPVADPTDRRPGAPYESVESPDPYDSDDPGRHAYR
jgi:hypothetical protein